MASLRKSRGLAAMAGAMPSMATTLRRTADGSFPYSCVRLLGNGWWFGPFRGARSRARVLHSAAGRDHLWQAVQGKMRYALHRRLRVFDSLAPTRCRHFRSRPEPGNDEHAIGAR